MKLPCSDSLLYVCYHVLQASRQICLSTQFCHLSMQLSLSNGYENFPSSSDLQAQAQGNERSCSQKSPYWASKNPAYDFFLFQNQSQSCIHQYLKAMKQRGSVVNILCAFKSPFWFQLSHFKIQVPSFLPFGSLSMRSFIFL